MAIFYNIVTIQFLIKVTTWAMGGFGIKDGMGMGLRMEFRMVVVVRLRMGWG